MPKYSDEQINAITTRFLRWKLPKDFCPDNGISFEPIANKGSSHEFVREPSGTNLLHFAQAKEMVLFMLQEESGFAEGNELADRIMPA